MRVVCLCSCQRAQIVGRSEYRPASAPAWLLGVLLLLLSYTGRAWLQHLCLWSLCLNQHSALWQRTGTEHNVFSLCEGPWRPSTPTSGGAREEAVLWGCFQRLSDPSSTVRETCVMHHADLSLKMADMAYCYCMNGWFFFFTSLSWLFTFCWFYFAPVLQREAKSAWISRVTICRMTAAFYHMFIAYMAYGVAGLVLHYGIRGGSRVFNCIYSHNWLCIKQCFLKTPLWHMQVFMYVVRLTYTKTGLADFIDIFYNV